MTPFGYVFLGAILFSILLTYAISRRWRNKEGDEFGTGSAIFLGLVLACLSLFVTVFTYSGVSWAYGLVCYPKYEAQIVDIDSRMVETEYTDDDGWTRTREQLMHTPILQFTDAKGQTVRLPSDVSSGGKPKIGDTMTIAYMDGKLHEVSFASFLLMFGLLLFVAVSGYLLLFAIYYVVGWDSRPLLKFGATVFSKGIFPLALFGMLAGFVWAILQTVLGQRNDLTVWVIAVSAFFSAAICQVLYLYLKSAYGNKGGPSDT